MTPRGKFDRTAPLALVQAEMSGGQRDTNAQLWVERSEPAESDARTEDTGGVVPDSSQTAAGRTSVPTAGPAMPFPLLPLIDVSSDAMLALDMQRRRIYTNGVYDRL